MSQDRYPTRLDKFRKWSKAMEQGAVVDKPNYSPANSKARSPQKAPRRRRRYRRPRRTSRRKTNAD